MFRRIISLVLLFSFLVVLTGCPKGEGQESNAPITSLNGVPVRRLNYRFESDVPAPSEEAGPGLVEPRNEAVQKDFDDSRLVEVLDRTITSPNKLRVLAVYRRLHDQIRQFRLDMYTPEGALLRKITHDEMAVHFPDTIRWSPDSNNVVFIAVVRDSPPVSDGEDQLNGDDVKKAIATPTPTPTPTPGKNKNTNSNAESSANSNNEPPSASPPDALEPPKNVLTFRTEQLYICDSNGSGIKPLTKKEGLMYFYFVWAPNSVALVALASPFTEWKFRKDQMEKIGELFVPAGRPRLIEKNGRERLLDDYPTRVHPVWSPDSTKIAVALNMQIRMYDAVVDAPTQAAIPLRNSMLLSSKQYDDRLKREEEAASNKESNSNSGSGSNTSENKNSNANVGRPTTMLPDARTLVSFNPIVRLKWELETMIYLQTGYIKTFVDNEAENRRSYMRWHRLVLSRQAAKLQIFFAYHPNFFAIHQAMSLTEKRSVSLPV